jgi:hypothetical protein
MWMNATQHQVPLSQTTNSISHHTVVYYNVERLGFYPRHGQNFYLRRHVKNPGQLTESHHYEAVAAALHTAHIFMALRLTAHMKNFIFCVFRRTVSVLGMAMATRASSPHVSNRRQKRRCSNIRSTRVALASTHCKLSALGTTSVPSNHRLKCEHPTNEHCVRRLLTRTALTDGVGQGLLPPV